MMEENNEEKFYVFVDAAGNLNGCGQCICEEMNCIEVSQELFDTMCEKPNCIVLIDGVPTIDASLVEEYEQQSLIANAKDARTYAVESITVEVDGMIFDGDESAQTRMSRAVEMARSQADIQGEGLNYLDMTTYWVLADNTIAEVTIKQLAQALYQAGQQQTELWMIPYQI